MFYIDHEFVLNKDMYLVKNIGANELVVTEIPIDRNERIFRMLPTRSEFKSGKTIGLNGKYEILKILNKSTLLKITSIQLHDHVGFVGLTFTGTVEDESKNVLLWKKAGHVEDKEIATYMSVSCRMQSTN